MRSPSCAGRWPRSRQAGEPGEAVPVLERRMRIPNQTDTVRRELDAARRDAAKG
jgi:hypothetical protein